LVFFACVALVSAYLLPHDMDGWMAKIPLIGRYGARDLLATGDGEHCTLTVLLMALVVGLVAHEFGFHPAVGAYVAVPVTLTLWKPYYDRAQAKLTDPA
jgi:Kef-type K+ transport system membrane component KefB